MVPMACLRNTSAKVESGCSLSIVESFEGQCAPPQGANFVDKELRWLLNGGFFFLLRLGIFLVVAELPPLVAPAVCEHTLQRYQNLGCFLRTIVVPIGNKHSTHRQYTSAWKCVVSDCYMYVSIHKTTKTVLKY